MQNLSYLCVMMCTFISVYGFYEAMKCVACSLDLFKVNNM